MKDQMCSASGVSKQNRPHKGTIIYMGNFALSGNNAAAHRVMNNGKVFRRLGYNIVFLGITNEPYFQGVRLSAFDDHVYEEAYPDTTKRWIKHIFNMNHIRSVAKRYDDLKLIIAYNIPFATFKALKKAFRSSGVKLAYDCTEWNNYAEGSFMKRLYKRVDEFEIVHFLGGKCRNIIVVSSMIQNQYQRCNTLLLPPLVDVTDPIWKQESVKDQGVFDFCFSAATFDNKDNPENLIRAFHLLEGTDVRLSIIGLDFDNALQKYPHISDIITNDDRISFLGLLSHEDTVRRLLSSDCFVFFRNSTRRNNAGFPTKFVEAYTCSTLILTNDTSDIRCYAEKSDRVLLTDNDSISEMKEKMESLRIKGVQAEKKTDTTFDYRHYIDRAEKWINNRY